MAGCFGSGTLAGHVTRPASDGDGGGAGLAGYELGVPGQVVDYFLREFGLPDYSLNIQFLESVRWLVVGFARAAEKLHGRNSRFGKTPLVAGVEFRLDQFILRAGDEARAAHNMRPFVGRGRP